MNHPVKRIALFIAPLLIATAGMAPAPAIQRQMDVTATPFSRAPYRAGERLTYNVSFSNFISAAHIELFIAGRSIVNGRAGIQLRAHVETTGVVNAALYSINNDYITYIDPDSGVPFRTQEIVRTGGRTADTSSEYNEPLGTSAIPPRAAVGGFPGTFDLVSALYRIRALPLGSGAIYRLQVRTETDTYDAEVRVRGRQMVKTAVGSFPAIMTETRVPGNGAVNNYRLRIYFTDDDRHVPLTLTVQHPAGEIRAELAASELPSTPPTEASPTPVPLATATGTRPLAADIPFNAGENLNYQVFVGTNPRVVGTASFQVRPRARYFNRDGIQLSVKAQTLAEAQRVFLANDQITSYVDPTTLLPYRTELALIEGRRRVNETLTIDQDRGTALTARGARIEIPVGTHDFASLFYALRLFNVTPPRRNAVSILLYNRPLTLFLASVRREIIDLGGQKIPAIQIALTTDDPQPDKWSVRGWISDDRRRLPLRLTANTPLGPVRADLVIIPLTRQ